MGDSPTLSNSGVGDVLGDIAFTGSGWTDQDRIAPLVDELQGMKFEAPTFRGLGVVSQSNSSRDPRSSRLNVR